MKHKAQYFASWMFSEYAFKIRRKKGNDFLIIVPLKNGKDKKGCYSKFNIKAKLYLSFYSISKAPENKESLL